MKKLIFGASIAVVSLLFSCSGGSGPEESAKNYIEALNAEDFDKAKEFATKESAGMLDFMKSISSMSGEKKADSTKQEIKDLKCVIEAGDSLAVCTFMVDGKEEKLNMKKVEDKWLAHQPKEGPPGGLDPGMMDMDAPADSAGAEAGAVPVSEKTESK
jgi:hypothetical protein